MSLDWDNLAKFRTRGPYHQCLAGAGDDRRHAVQENDGKAMMAPRVLGATPMALLT
jgi:hypothetical protein